MGVGPQYDMYPVSIGLRKHTFNSCTHIIHTYPHRKLNKSSTMMSLMKEGEKIEDTERTTIP